MKLGRSTLIANRTREALKGKAKRKTAYDSMRLIGGDSLSSLYPTRIKMPLIFRGYGVPEEAEVEIPVKSNLQVNTGVELAFKFPYDDYHRFHINVWHACSDTFSRSTMAVTHSTCQDANDKFEQEILVMFNNKKDAEEAQAWWDSYKARFHDMTKTYLPRLANGQELTGCALEIKPREDNNSYELESKSTEISFFSEWVWLVKNTTDRVYWTRHFWIFDNQAEMVQFELSGDIEQLERQVF